MSAPQGGRDIRPPFEGYRILTNYRGATFLHIREAVSALQQRPEPETNAELVPDTKGTQFRITSLPPESAPLFVAGFFMYGTMVAVMRECVEDMHPTPENTRYVVLLNLGDDWRIEAVIAGPSTDAAPFARDAIEHMIEHELNA